MNKIKYFSLKRPILFCFILLLLTPQNVNSQYPANYQYTLLPARITDQIIGSASGELAMLHINNLAPYSRPRKDSEFPGNLAESGYIMDKLKEYGIRNCSLDTVGQTVTWRGIEGSVWEVAPESSKIADYNDIPEMLAEGSRSAEVRAKLIWAGEGEQSFFDDNRQNIKGKIVVTSGNIYSVHQKAISAGALGTISYFSSRPLVDPVQIPNMGIGGEGFAFLLPPKEGVLLRDRLLRRENIEVEVKVKSSVEKVDLLVPECVIQGTDSTAGEIIFTAHLFEGFVKMGANDNMSGSAVILEVAHLLNDLIEQGKIDRPHRSIRFLWVPEFSGTIPWVNMHLEKVKRALCNINLDMVGLRLRDNKSFFCLNRSGYSTANCANDVMESYFRFTGETNVDGITDDLGRRGFSRRIISSTGTNDPFYYRILSLHGSSDNAVFNDWGIGVPGIKMITWPDLYYHSSEDSPDKCDPTQLRRAIFIAAAGAYTMSSAGDETAIAILSEMYSGAVTRMGIQTGKANDMILKSDAETIALKYKRAVSNLEGIIMGEKSALERVKQLSVQSQVLAAINNRKGKLDDILQLQVSELRDLMITRCRNLGIDPVSIKTGDLEKAASRIVPHQTSTAAGMGYGGDQRIISKLSTDFRLKYPYNNIVNTDEVAGLADGRRNLLQIKKIVDAQFERESPLQDIINYFIVLKEAGLMEY
jgi:hypothetical protein